MSKKCFAWQETAPSKPDVYTTRRNKSRYQTLRYWDGECWYEIAWSGSRGGVPFKWPKPSRTKQPSWAIGCKDALRVRKISSYLCEIQWGESFEVFDEREVLAHLVKTGVLRPDWADAYQEEMRSIKKGK